MTEIYNASFIELSAPDPSCKTFITTIYYWKNRLRHFPARDARDLVCNHRALAIC